MTKSFDVFLSHNSKDKPTVRELAEALRARGLKVWLDEWELVPGQPWQEALEEVIETTGSSAVLVGRDGLGPWHAAEMRGCLTEFVRRKLPVIPVLLPGAPAEPRLPLFLTQVTWADLRSGLTEEGLDQLQWGITRNKPDRLSLSIYSNPAALEAAAATQTVHSETQPASSEAGPAPEIEAPATVAPKQSRGFGNSATERLKKAGLRAGQLVLGILLVGTVASYMHGRIDKAKTVKPAAVRSRHGAAEVTTALNLAASMAGVDQFGAPHTAISGRGRWLGSSSASNAQLRSFSAALKPRVPGLTLVYEASGWYRPNPGNLDDYRLITQKEQDGRVVLPYNPNRPDDHGFTRLRMWLEGANAEAYDVFYRVCSGALAANGPVAKNGEWADAKVPAPYGICGVELWFAARN